MDEHVPYRITSYHYSSDTIDTEFSSISLDPLLIAGSAADALTGSIQDHTTTGAVSLTPGTDIMAVSTELFTTSDISLHGTFGIAKNRWKEASDAHYDSAWEANLGIIYKLFNNFQYEMHFGYMETGDFFHDSGTLTGNESIIMINNKLTMSF